MNALTAESHVRAMINMCIKALILILIVALMFSCTATGPSTITKGKRVTAPVGQIIQCLEPIPEDQRLACEDKASPEVENKQ